MQKKWSLNKQLALPIMGLSFLTLTAMTLFSGWKARAIVEKEALDHLQATAGEYSEKVRFDLERAFVMARIIATQAESDVAHKQQSRERFILTLKDFLDNNKFLLGTWLGYEPNAYDGQDLIYKKTPYHEASGRFIPYWARSDGKIVYDTLLNEKTPVMGIWYTIPQEKKTEAILEPYEDLVGGKKMMMTSITVPILRSGTFVGVAAVDIALDAIQTQVQAIKPYEGSSSYLVSYDGKYVSAPDPNLLTKKAEFPFSGDLIAAAIQKGDALQIKGIDPADGKEYFYTLSALTIGATARPWALVIRTPSRVVLAAVAELTIFQMTVALIGLLSLGATVFYISRRISSMIATHAHELEGSALRVNDSIEQLSIAGQSLSESSSSSAASLEETVASLEEITSMVKMNSDNARQAASLSTVSSEAAVKGEKDMQELTKAMHDISKSSKQIEEIINVIDDIAFQTNLLALNASVEAARAGEQGKGFAVVAEAVRTLAQRSATAAKDISSLIKDSVQKIELGTKRADASGVNLTTIVNSVKKVANLNTEIASASEEQTVGIQQISKAMSDLDQSVQSNAASSEEIAGTSEEIRKQSRLMKNVTVDLKLIVVGGNVAS
jgi:methyl-accepting chemotaxis protein